MDLDELRRAVDEADNDEQWIERALAYAAALAAELETNAVRDLRVEIAQRLAAAPALAIAAHRTLAKTLQYEAMYDEARAELAAAIAVARAPAEHLEVRIDLVDLLEADGARDEALAMRRECVALARQQVPPDLAALAFVRLAEQVPAEAETHARAALEIVRDPSLRDRATYCVANSLFERGDYQGTERELLALPPGHEWAPQTTALHEHVLRQLGRMSEEVTPEQMIERPPRIGDGPGEVLPELAEYAVIPDAPPLAAIAFFTQPTDLVASLAGYPLGSSNILQWSYGELTSEADLDSQRIFGPVRSYHCACGRYRGNRYERLICSRCSVELLPTRIRKTRLGHLRLHAPVIHPWFAPAAALLLDVGIKELQKLPGREAIEQLDALNIYTLAGRLDVDLPQASEAMRKKLLPVKTLIDAIQSSNDAGHYIQPRDFALELVPVLSPDLELDVDMAKVQRAYRRMLVEQDQSAAVRALFACFTSRPAADSPP